MVNGNWLARRSHSEGGLIGYQVILSKYLIADETDFLVIPAQAGIRFYTKSTKRIQTLF